LVFQTDAGQTEQDDAATQAKAPAPATTTEAPVAMAPETQEIDNDEINDKMDQKYNSGEQDDYGNVLTTRGLTFQAPQARRQTFQVRPNPSAASIEQKNSNDQLKLEPCRSDK